MPPTHVGFPHLSEGEVFRARAEAILWIRSAVARHGISVEQLEQAGCFAPVKPEERFQTSTKYIDAAGHVWDGSGTVPEWLQRAVDAGQSMEHFRIA
ncbi:H-NS family nucleoid-associated regulatory protein [Cupriavidus sp. YR651]|uniref:H-NS family nucleoid-associated regulatory protein n=1 Tax=Cupriavidus sp. YR651 TaxID=1855315 RepID=UPI000B855809|nr:H-NS family nucleoid-associated regulatory protein [Cupriavidus sp. YR651]